MKNSNKKQKTVITGSDTKQTTIKGVEIPPPRGHLYVSRIGKESSLDDLISLCASKGAEPVLSREVSKNTKSMRIFIWSFQAIAQRLLKILISGLQTYVSRGTS